jgi:hypothetical protein
MLVQIEIPDEIIRGIVDRVVQESLAAPGGRSFGDPGGLVYTEAKRQVQAWASALDLSEQIRTAAHGRLPVIVDQVVSDALKAEVKKQTKALREEGALFRLCAEDLEEIARLVRDGSL